MLTMKRKRKRKHASKIKGKQSANRKEKKIVPHKN